MKDIQWTAPKIGKSVEMGPPGLTNQRLVGQKLSPGCQDILGADTIMTTQHCQKLCAYHGQKGKFDVYLTKII